MAFLTVALSFRGVWIVELKRMPLARAELAALAAAFGARARFSGVIALLDKPVPFWRLTQAHWAAREFPISRRLSEFRVTGPHELELAIGKKLNGSVNLGKPKTVVRAAYARNRAVFGVECWRYSQRAIPSPRVRYPGMLKPETARLLVNLAGVRPGEKVLDPFCGTGTLLVGAALAGARVVGVDVDARMVEATKQNLQAAGVAGNVERGNFLLLKQLGKFDVVITDLPYGRASRRFKFRETTALGKISEALQARGRALVVSDRRLRAGKHFMLENVLEMRVHGSLTRKIHSFYVKTRSGRTFKQFHISKLGDEMAKKRKTAKKRTAKRRTTKKRR